MIRRFSVNYAIFSIFLDAGIIGGSMNLARILRPKLNSLPFAEYLYDTRLPWIIYPVFIVVWISILLAFTVYDGRKRIRLVDEISSVVFSSAIACVSEAGILYLSYREVSRLFFITYALIATLGLLSWRLIARAIFRLKNTGFVPERKALVIGAGLVGVEVRDQIVGYKDIPISFAGFLDDNPDKPDMVSQILGRLEDAREVIGKYRITDVVIALPRWAFNQVNELVAELHDLPVRVWVIPDYFNLSLYKATIGEFAGLPLLDLRAPALTEYQRLLKRLFDLIFGTIFLICFSPVMLIAAIAIKLDSPGPILFKQKRVGENGKLFTLLKFRSMVVDADKIQEKINEHDDEGRLIHKVKDDPRITRVGRFIRRTSIDELPQLFNVLIGDMSLVGPRPELPWLVEKYETWQRSRFAVPQGITGWWQVNGQRDKPMHFHTEDDIYYVQHYSIFLDILILLKTAIVVLRCEGAY